MAVELGSAVGKITIDASGVTAGVAAAQQSLGRAESSLATIGGAATRAGLGLAAIAAPIVGLGGAAVKAAGDFESQMNVLAVAAQGGATSLEDLRDVAIKAGSDVALVGVSSSDVAEAMTNFAKAGLDTNAMLGDMNGYLEGTAGLSGALRAAIDLAAASELDLAQASELVVTTMSTFGLTADQASAAMNSYVQAADGSVASVSDLAAAMSNVGPTMATFGFSLEDVNTALAILSTRGITGAEAGTALKSMFTNVMRGTDDTRDALKKLNITLYDQAGAMRSMPEIMAQFERAMSGMTEEQRNHYVQLLAGTYGMKAMNTLLAEGTDGWDAMTTAIAEGATMQETAAARTQGFNAAMEQLKDSIQTFMIQVGTPLIENVLTPLVRRLSEVIGRLTEVNPKFLEASVVIGAVTAALGGALIVFGQITNAAASVGSAVRAMASVIGVAGPGITAALGPVVAIIAGIAAAALALREAWERNFLGLRDLTDAIGDDVALVLDKIKLAVELVVAFLKGDLGLDDLKTRLRAVFMAMMPALDNIRAELAAWWAGVVEYVRTNAPAWGAQLQAGIATAWSKLNEWGDTVGAPLLAEFGGRLNTWLNSAVMRGIELFAENDTELGVNFGRIIGTLLGKAIDLVAGTFGFIGKLIAAIFSSEDAKAKIPDEYSVLFAESLREWWRGVIVGFEEGLRASASLTALGDAIGAWLERNVPTDADIQARFEGFGARIAAAIGSIFPTDAELQANLSNLPRLMGESLAEFSRQIGTFLAEAGEPLRVKFLEIREKMQTTWETITKNLMPGLQGLRNRFDEVKAPLIAFRNAVLEPIRSAFELIAGAIQTVIEKAAEVKTALSNFSLPGWIQNAIDRLTTLVNLVGGAGAGAGAGAQQSPNPRAGGAPPPDRGDYGRTNSVGQSQQATWNVTINVTGNGEPREIGRQVELGVLRAARAMGAA